VRIIFKWCGEELDAEVAPEVGCAPALKSLPEFKSCA
jgi:hypothetical protein